MAGFVYFVPNGPQVLTREHLHSIGFEHADSAGTPGCPVRTVGPGGEPGCAFGLGAPTCPGGKSADVGYYTSREEPDKNPQTWKKILGGKMWLGWANANPPTPADLQRKEVTGIPVLLEDGNEWIIPIYASVDKETTLSTLLETTTLPTTLGLGMDGNCVQSRILPEFARTWELTKRVFKAVKQIDIDTLTQQESWEIACIALSHNYYVTEWEVDALGAITTENLLLISAAVLGVSHDQLEKAE